MITIISTVKTMLTSMDIHTRPLELFGELFHEAKKENRS